MEPGRIGDHNPVFCLWDDAGKVAIFLAARVMVCLDESTHSAELIFELVDVFRGDNAVEVGDFVAYPDEGILRARGLRCLRHCALLVGDGQGGFL